MQYAIKNWRRERPGNEAIFAAFVASPDWCGIKARSLEALIEFALSSPDTCSPTAFRRLSDSLSLGLPSNQKFAKALHTGHAVHAAHCNSEALIVSTKQIVTCNRLDVKGQFV